MAIEDKLNGKTYSPLLERFETAKNLFVKYSLHYKQNSDEKARLKLETAVDYCTSILSQNPERLQREEINQIGVYLLRSNLYMTLKDFSSAQKDIDLAKAKLGKEDAFLLEMQGMLYFEKEEYSKAINVLSRAIKLNASKSLYILRARSYFELQDYEHTISDVNNALLEDIPPITKSRIDNLNLIEISKLAEHGIVVPKKINFDDMVAFYIRGVSLFNLDQERYGDAKVDFDKIISALSPHIKENNIKESSVFFDSLLYRAKILYSWKNYDSALKEINYLIAKKGFELDSAYLKGNILMKLGKFKGKKGAYEVFNKIIRKFPEEFHGEARFKKAQMRLIVANQIYTKDTDKALESYASAEKNFKMAFKLGYEPALSQAYLGVISLRQKKKNYGKIWDIFDESVKLYKKIKPKDRTDTDHLALLISEQGMNYLIKEKHFDFKAKKKKMPSFKRFKRSIKKGMETYVYNLFYY